MILAYRATSRAEGKTIMALLSEAINGRLEHISGTARGFRSLICVAVRKESNAE